MYIPNYGDKPGIKYLVFGKPVPLRERKSGIKFKSIRKWRDQDSANSPFVDISSDKSFIDDIMISILK